MRLTYDTATVPDDDVLCNINQRSKSGPQKMLLMFLSGAKVFFLPSTGAHQTIRNINQTLQNITMLSMDHPTETIATFDWPVAGINFRVMIVRSKLLAPTFYGLSLFVISSSCERKSCF